MRFLGVDYGNKKIGLALSDEGHTIATPYKVVENNEEIHTVFKDLVEQKEVQAVVIGESRNYAGEENPIMEDIHAFKKEIEKQFALPVYFESELLTSQEARRQPQAADEPRSRKKRKQGAIDASAAALILQSYLDKHKT